MKTAETNKPMATKAIIDEYFANNKKASELMNLSTDIMNYPEEVDALMERNNELLNQNDWFSQPFEECGKIGMKNVKGDVIVPAIFDGCVQTFHLLSNADATIMEKGGKMVLVKTDGSGDILSETYDKINVNEYMPSRYYVENQGKEGLITDTGKVLLQGVDKFDGYRDGIYFFIDGGKYGLVDGENVIAAKFDEIDANDDYEIKVRQGNEWGHVLNSGEFTNDEETEDDWIHFWVD